jgi:thiamine biosynthesis protein ThiS
MITLNNKPYNWTPGLTVEKLLELEKIEFKLSTMTVKVKGVFISMKDYASTPIEDEDKVLIIQFSPGG